MADSGVVHIGWSRHAVSLAAPGAFAGGYAQDPTGFSVSADGSTATFTNVTISAQVGGTATVNGTVTCPAA